MLEVLYSGVDLQQTSKGDQVQPDRSMRCFRCKQVQAPSRQSCHNETENCKHACITFSVSILGGKCWLTTGDGRRLMVIVVTTAVRARGTACVVSSRAAIFNSCHLNINATVLCSS